MRFKRTKHNIKQNVSVLIYKCILSNYYPILTFLLKAKAMNFKF